MKTITYLSPAIKIFCIFIKTDPRKKFLPNFSNLKIKFLTILLLLTSSILSAQVPKGTLSLEDTDFNGYFMNSAKIPIVKGKILNLSPNDFKKIKITYTIVTPFENFQNKKVTSVNSDGSFNLQLEYPFPYQQIWLSVGDTLYTCLYANSDLFIELDAEKVDKKNGIRFNGNGIKFLGSDGELTNLMNNHILFKRKQQLEINDEIGTLMINKELPYKEFLLKYDKLYSKFQAIDNEFIKLNPTHYAWLIENERMTCYYRDLFPKFLNNRMESELWEKVKNHKCYSVSNESTGFYGNLLGYISITAGKYQISDWNAIGQYSLIDENGRKLIDSLNYYQTTLNLKSYNRLVPKAFTIFSDTLTAIGTMKTIKFLDATFDTAKADFLKIRIGSKDQAEQKIMYELVLKNITTDWCKSAVNSEYQKLMDRMISLNTILTQPKSIRTGNNIGQVIEEMPFGAKLYRVNNMHASELLTAIKDSFEGKAVLIDFWATWCAPCLAEMPYSKKLHDETLGMPIEFVYLCTSNNSTLERWKSKIAELKIPGTHIFVDDTIETDLMNLFSFVGFPNYALIDAQGKYKPGAITRPSLTDKLKLAELINKANR